ncbi:MAG TPA: hypothetical protein VMN39_08750, partial [Longimicrobiaceae bacterium]|nr:hypothetical protein [Longimicrobiaceae bacterium]
AVQGSPRQEIATHTLSHYYCLEAGQDRSSFAADLEAARAVAERFGIRLRSIVFPRNQHNPAYDDLLLAHGITTYRGNPRSWAWRFDDTRASRRPLKRALRLVDAYAPVTGAGTTRWEEVLRPSRLSDVRATRPLVPYRPGLEALEGQRLTRILRGIRHAARNREIFHLWWHPHNFGRHAERSLSFLRSVFQGMDRCRSEHGLLSLSMAEVDRAARYRLGRETGRPVGLSHDPA